MNMKVYLFTSSVSTMALSAMQVSPLSIVDIRMLDFVKEHTEVIKEKNTMFYAANKKAVVWQETARKFSDQHKKHYSKSGKYEKTSERGKCH